MQIVGIISEYNPFHLGHLGQINKTKQVLGEDCAIVCVMSGNFVQRGEPAIFAKHARAEAAVLCGVDLVIELPSPYALSSAEGFARGGVFLLDALGVCDYISFGSEYGEIEPLATAAEMIVTQTANELIVKWLEKGISYAAAQQKVADELMGEESKVFSSPNNLLGIEYLKALTLYNSDLKPMTVTRTGGEHDGDTGYSASRLRKIICSGGLPWDDMPKASAEICKREIEQSRGPVSVKKHFEIALLSRLRMLSELDFLSVPDATEGLDKRMARYAHSEPTIDAMLEKIKTKRYAMSRIRRMLMCAALGITANDTVEPPAYIRVLAINEMGMDILSKAREKAKLPIITKPASIQKMKGRAVEMFYKEAAITDFYSLAFNSEQHRIGGNEWRQTPIILV